jgi:hypothetical protein
MLILYVVLWLRKSYGSLRNLEYQHFFPKCFFKVFCQWCTDDERRYWQLYSGLKLTIASIYVFWWSYIQSHIKLWQRPSVHLEIIQIIYMVIFVSLSLSTLCIIFKIITFFIIPTIGILLRWGNLLDDWNIYLRVCCTRVHPTPAYEVFVLVGIYISVQHL